MKKFSTLDAYFQKKNIDSDQINIKQLESNNIPSKIRRVEVNEKFDINQLERDPGLRPQICEYPVHERDEVRRAYYNAGPFQPICNTYPKLTGKYPRSFQASWYKLFPSWLEYSPHADAAYCLLCYLFPTTGSCSSNAFVINGFRSWKKVKDGRNCSFLLHEGKDCNSSHRNAQKACEDLMNQSSHIMNKFTNFTSKQVAENRLRLKASIDVTKWLTLQGCALRGHDETKTSKNRGNFFELLDLIASYNEEVANVINNALGSN